VHDCSTRPNVVGTQQLLESARRAEVQRFVHVSTDEVYGSIDDGAWREDHLLQPNSPYSSSQGRLGPRRALLSANLRTQRHGDALLEQLRTAPVSREVNPLFVTNLFDGVRVPLYGDGLHVRDWLFVRRPLPGHTPGARKRTCGEIYNIGGGTELTNIDIHSFVARSSVGADESLIEPATDRLGHDRRYSVDWSKIRDELGLNRPETDF